MEWKVEWKKIDTSKWNGKKKEWKWNGKWNGKNLRPRSGMEIFNYGLEYLTNIFHSTFHL